MTTAESVRSKHRCDEEQNYAFSLLSQAVIQNLLYSDPKSFRCVKIIFQKVVSFRPKLPVWRLFAFERTLK